MAEGVSFPAVKWNQGTLLANPYFKDARTTFFEIFHLVLDQMLVAMENEESKDLLSSFAIFEKLKKSIIIQEKRLSDLSYVRLL